MTVLMRYLFKEDFDMCAKLIIRGANMDYCNKNGLTALHLMIENRLLKACRFLLEKGSNPHIVDLQGEDCCDKA